MEKTIHEHYSEIAKKAVITKKKKYGDDYFVKIFKKIGDKNKEKGSEYFRKIGLLGAKARWKNKDWKDYDKKNDL